MPNARTTTNRVPVVVLALAVPVIAVLAVLGTRLIEGPSSSATAGAAKANEIVIRNFTFTPAKTTVTRGTTITVTNRDNVTHTLTAQDGSFDTKPLPAGRSVTITPDRAGTFPYSCQIHPSMTGTLVVR